MPGADATPAAPRRSRLAVDIAFASDAFAVRAALIDTDAALARIGVSADDRSTVELVLAEILNNVVEHAYAAWAGPIELRIELRDHILLCETRDRGTPLQEDALPAGDALPVAEPIEDHPEGGFGWYLIRTLTRDLSFNRAQDQNCLCFAVPLEAGVPAV